MGYVFMRFGRTSARRMWIACARRWASACSGRPSRVTAFLLLNLMDELICNILEHGSATWVELEVHPREKDVTIILRDDGKAFDVGSSIHASMPAGHADPDGRHMGLYMVGHIADTWAYKRLPNDVNELDWWWT